ncbi:MAG: sigma 54-interacting transcriptional regulator, partial [Pseudomonadales bacterium]|nr:sigma 54-interacting transcriptional regulator [Pseudomonadales bacterium]
LFRDELAATAPLVQEKLLRVIEYGEFERVGGSKTLTTDVRLIAATNEDLPTLARRSRFREDLLDRLAFDVITLPPLRARPEDIMILAEHFAVNMATELEREYFPGFTGSARKVLTSYDWPGNVRELKNVVERSVYRSMDPDDMVDIIHLDPFESPFRPTRTRSVSTSTTEPDETADAPSAPSVPSIDEFPIDFKQSVQDYEINLIKNALASSQFNQKKTAEALGVTYHQLRGYLKKYNLLEGS